jgi:signal transduction histidine kinase
VRRLFIPTLNLVFFVSVTLTHAVLGDASQPTVVQPVERVAVKEKADVAMGADGALELKVKVDHRKKAVAKKAQSTLSAKPRVEKKVQGWDPENAINEKKLEDTVASFSANEAETKIKQKEVVQLVGAAIDFFKKTPTDKALSIFTHTKQFARGELYIFVYDTNGTVLAHGQEKTLLFRNMMDVKDTFGVQFVKDMIEKAKRDGGWVTYEWRNATKISYAQKVVKEDKEYVIGCGFYPHAKADAVVSLVKGAVAHFNEVLKQGGSAQEAFSVFSYPLGKFLMGDLYLYALDSKGTLMAQGDRPGLIGQNVWDYRDADGKPANQLIIKGLMTSSNPNIWIEYKSKKTRKLAYAERVKDAKGNDYFIVAGYYPEAGRDAAVELVRSGYQYLKSHGLKQMNDAVTTKSRDDFVFGDLSLFVYDMNGVVVADGANIDLVGKSEIGSKDSDGHEYVKEFIEKAKEGGGWVDIKVNNLFQSVYVEKVDLGLEDYVIGCGVYPVSKREQTLLLVKTALSYLRDNETEVAFRAFTQQGSYIRGDLSVFVYDLKGLCCTNGDDFETIWKNEYTAKDSDGRPYVKQFIDRAKSGGDWVTYKMDGKLKYAYVEPLEKDGVQYCIGCAYFK